MNNKIISILLYIILHISTVNSASNEVDESSTKPEYWAHLVKNDQSLRELVALERKCADKCDQFVIIPKDELRNQPGYVPYAPMTLFPSEFPRRMFDQAVAVQTAVNLLYFRASRDYEFLMDNFKELAKQHKLIAQSMKILEQLHKDGPSRQPIVVQITRSDYMVHIENKDDGEQELQLKQIEVQVENGGGAQNSARQTRVHRMMLSELGLDASSEVLRENCPYRTYAEAAYLAWLKFGDPTAIMVIPVAGAKSMKKMSDYEIRAAHYHRDLEIEFNKASSGQMQVEYLSMEECEDRLTLNPDDFSLTLDDGRKVAVVFYRWFGADEKSFRARLKMERSTAVKVPTVAMYLMGMKKGQQVLAQPGVLERFFPDPAESHYVDAIREVFTGLWALDQDDEKTQKVIEDAMEHPEKFVMKPNLEGGGNNTFGQDIVKKLQSLSPERRALYILMQRLNPMTVSNYFVRPGREPFRVDNAVPELSIYGALVGDAQTGAVLHNRVHGNMVRTKRGDSNEGGIFVGAAVFDSLYLY